jgi:hypothetical protein
MRTLAAVPALLVLTSVASAQPSPIGLDLDHWGSGRPQPALPPPSIDVPSRDDVRSALRTIEPEARRCSARNLMVRVSITFAGRTGRVRDVTVEGDLGGTPIAMCVARAVRGAHVPRFRRETLSVRYPVRLGGRAGSRARFEGARLTRAASPRRWSCAARRAAGARR